MFDGRRKKTALREGAKGGSAVQPVRLVSEGLTSVSALVALVIMVLGVCDVALRYAFNAPITWAFETLTHLLLPSMFFLALAETYRRREHVFVDLVLQLLSASAQRMLRQIGDAIGAVVLCLIAKGFIGKATEAYASGDVYVIADTDVPVWLTLVTPIVGLTAAVVTLVVNFFARPSGSDEHLSVD